MDALSNTALHHRAVALAYQEREEPTQAAIDALYRQLLAERAKLAHGNGYLPYAIRPITLLAGNAYSHKRPTNRRGK